MKTFGDRLRKLRKERDITQATLAEYLGVVASAVGKYETIDNAYPSVDALIKISEYFDVSIDYLLTGTPSHQHCNNDNQVKGSLSNSSVIQASGGGVVYSTDNGRLSPEITELLRIYNSLDGKNRLSILNFAVNLEERSREK